MALTLPVHPYALGVWLTRGIREGGAVSLLGEHNGLLDKLALRGIALGKPHALKVTVSKHTILGLRSHLRPLGLVGHRHIPPLYLNACREDRRSLYEGLLDARSPDEAARGVYETSEGTLAQDIVSLTTSLGSPPPDVSRFLIQKRGILRRDWYRLTFLL